MKIRPCLAVVAVVAFANLAVCGALAAGTEEPLFPQTTLAYQEFGDLLRKLKAEKDPDKKLEIAIDILDRAEALREQEAFTFSSPYEYGRDEEYRTTAEPEFVPEPPPAAPVGGVEFPASEESLRRIHMSREYYLSKGQLVETALQREAMYRDVILRAFEKAGISPELRCVAFVESSFRTDAVGTKTRFGKAAGMWQFIPGTARARGLNVDLSDRSKDDRFDLEASTREAAGYLHELLDREVWKDSEFRTELALASYNWGPGNVERMVQRHGADFWSWPGATEPAAVRQVEAIPKETYWYVPRVFAAIELLRERGAE